MFTRHDVRRWIAVLACAAGSAIVCALDVRVVDPPDAPPAVAKKLESRYLSEDQRKDIRIYHGVWSEGDLDSPARKARAALVLGNWNDPALEDPASDPLDRAHAMILRGEAAAAHATIETAGESAKAKPFRAALLGARAFLLQGKPKEAEALVAPVAAKLSSEQIDDAEELVDGARCLMVRSRLPASVTGRAPAAGDFQAILGTLARARELDRLSWRAHLAEAELLLEKDNPAEGEGAARQALELCPRSAEARFVLGSLAVDSFAVDAGEKLASELNELAPNSAFAAVISSRGRLRQSDPVGASEAIEGAVKAYPISPMLLAMQAAVAAAGFDFASADRLIAAYTERFPDGAEAPFEVGRVLSDQRQYAESAKYLGEAARRAPGWADPAVELGLMELQAGRDLPAFAALTKARELDPFNKRADNSLTLVKELMTYETVESAHFVIRFKPGVDGVLAREMLDPLEANFVRVTGKDSGGIDHLPGQKTMIELMPDHRWFAVRIAGMPALHTIAASTGPVVAMEAPRAGPNHLVGPYDWVRVLRHEYTHTVTLDRTKNRLPHWFTEASAVYLEDAPRDFSAWTILAAAHRNDALFDFEQINLMFIRPEKPSDRPQAYAQGSWMYEFIVERWGAKAPLDLMDKYAAGVKEPDAFAQVLGKTREEFFEQFKTWAGEKLTLVGMAPAPGTQTLREILVDEAGGEVPEEPTMEFLEKCLAKHAENADLLELTIKTRLKGRGGGGGGEGGDGQVTGDLVPLLKRYALSRPVDPLPHKLLASWGMSSEGDTPGAEEEIIGHLEYLDIREQHSPSYAMELAHRYAARGDWDGAWGKALRAVRIAPYEARTRELAATIAVQRKDFGSAKWQIEALLALEPDREIHKKRLDALAKMKAASNP